jgi:hypothetical protein
VHVGESAWNIVSGKDLIAFIEHPGWDTFGKLLEDVAVTASLVAMVVAPFAAPELIEADGAALAGEDVAATTAEDGATSFGDVARGVNLWGGRVANGAVGLHAGDDFAQGNWKGGLIDTAFAVAPNLGSMPKNFDAIRGLGDDGASLFGIGDKQAETAIESVKGLQESTAAMNDYRTLRSWGINPVGAKSLAFDDGPPEVLHDVNLDDQAAIKAAVQQANEEAASAAGRAMHLGKPVAGLVDTFATDPTNSAVKRALHADGAACG